MKIKKILLLVSALLLLLLMNFSVVYGCFCQFIFRFRMDDDLTKFGEEYRGAELLATGAKKPEGWENLFLLVRTASGEKRVIVLQGSIYFENRYCYLPSRTLSVPEQSLYFCTARSLNETAVLTVGKDFLVKRENALSNPSPLDALYGILPFILLVAEILVGAAALRAKKKKTAPTAEAADLSAAAPMRPDELSEEAVRTLNRLSLRSGVGHPAQRVRPRQVLVPIAVLLALAVIGFAAIFFGFKWFVFNFEYSGDPSSLGEEYRGAEILSDSNMTGDQRLLELQTASGEVRYLVLESFPALYPGRYHYPPRQAEVVFRQSTESFRIRTASLDVQVDVMNGEALSRSVMSGSSNVWMEAEYLLAFVWLVILVGLAVWYARRIEPKRQAPSSTRAR